jgi:tetratricopeptide (TPR) repeat protein
LASAHLLATPRAEVKRGNVAADSGNTDAAQYHYVKALEEGADSSLVIYNIGNLMYERGEYEKASQAFMASLDTTASEERLTSGLYNLGNSFYESQKYDQAIQSYIETLKRNPEDVDAKHNLEMARRMLKEQQQQQQQQQSDQQKEQQENQEQKDKTENQPDEQQQEQNQPQDEQQQQTEQQQDTTGQQQQQPQYAQQMSKEEAERLLNALLQDEQNTLEEVRKVRMPASRKRERDW